MSWAVSMALTTSPLPAAAAVDAVFTHILAVSVACRASLLAVPGAAAVAVAAVFAYSWTV
jgi:hypothetical protein